MNMPPFPIVLWFIWSIASIIVMFLSAHEISDLKARVACEKLMAEKIAAYDASPKTAVSDPRTHCQYLQENNMLLPFYSL